MKIVNNCRTLIFFSVFVDVHVVYVLPLAMSTCYMPECLEDQAVSLKKLITSCLVVDGISNEFTQMVLSFLLNGRGRKQYKKSENVSEKFAKLNFPAMNNALNRFLGAIFNI